VNRKQPQRHSRPAPTAAGEPRGLLEERRYPRLGGRSAAGAVALPGRWRATEQWFVGHRRGAPGDRSASQWRSQRL